MKQNWLLQKLKTSQVFRLTVEIFISLVLFSWLPFVFQIISALILSVVCEVVLVKILTRDLKNKFSGKPLSSISNNLEKGKLS